MRVCVSMLCVGGARPTQRTRGDGRERRPATCSASPAAAAPRSVVHLRRRRRRFTTFAAPSELIYLPPTTTLRTIHFGKHVTGLHCNIIVILPANVVLPRLPTLFNMIIIILYYILPLYNYNNR